jgi:tetratricopeptide (TPR) repeat protein
MTFERDKYITEQDAQPLSNLLDLLEIDLTYIGQRNPTQSEQVLLRMDVVWQKIQKLEAAHLSTTAESAQFDYIVTSLKKNARAFLHDLGGPDNLRILREAYQPLPAQEWWQLEEIIAQRMKQQLQSAATTIGILALIGLVLVVLFNTVFKPDPIVVARYSHQMNAEQKITENDLTGALKEIDASLALGDDADLFVLRGVVLSQQGKTAEAAAEFAKAEKMLGDHNSLIISRSQAWLKVGMIDLALQDSTEAIRNDPSSAQGYYFYGKSLELKQSYYEAIDAYETASALAGKQGKSELNATIRISMAMLMQSLPQVLPTLTPTR